MKTKTLFTFVGGAIIGAVAAIVIVSRTNNILSDAEYKDYLMITNKDNLISAYKAFFGVSRKTQLQPLSPHAHNFISL